MADSAIQAFETHAPEYNALRRKLIPPYDRFYGSAVEAVAMFIDRPSRILDLGAGTGLLTSFFADAFKDARFVLQDGSPAMLDQAKELLGDRIEDVVVSDFAEPLPGGGFCAVISSLAIHHLSDDGKRDIYRRSFDALKPGGVFVNAEHVAGATPELDELFLAWHEREAKRLGATDENWTAALKRFEHDIRTPVAPQLQWLRDAGFEQVECLMKDHDFAVMAGRRPR